MAGPDGDGQAIGGDRLELGLAPGQVEQVLAAAEAHPRTVVALMAGSAVWMEEWRERVGAILMLWYPGMQGGAALVDVLLGRANPSGRLPFSVPARLEHLPFFDREARSIRYDLWHGYTRLEREGTAPAFPFGFGLSYTRFAFDAPTAALDATGERLRVEVEVANTGQRAGETVVQVYAGWAQPDPEQPHKRLCGFRRVALAPGERRRVALDLRLRDLAWFDAPQSVWRLGAPVWRLHVGGSSADADCVETTIELPERRWSLGEH
jgi:beta-glucosidase